jgi:hypothetical protein
MTPRIPINLSAKAINCFLLLKSRKVISLQSKGIRLKLTEPFILLFSKTDPLASEEDAKEKGC